jgi:hypothetical protein
MLTDEGIEKPWPDILSQSSSDYFESQHPETGPHLDVVSSEAMQAHPWMPSCDKK